MRISFSPEWFSRGSRLSGLASIIGSWQICHNVCTGLIGFFAIFGIALQGMPLLFLNRFQWPLWILAVSLFGITILVGFIIGMPFFTKRGLIGTGSLLIAGFPFSSSGANLIQIIGLSVLLAVIVWYLKSLVMLKEENNIVIDFVKHGRKIGAGSLGLIGVIFLIFIAVKNPANSFTANISQTPRIPNVKFTLFDVAKAQDIMDENHDGRCDSCGMLVEDCIAAGMLECTMDSNSIIGVLGSTHIHASLNVYENGEPVDLSQYGHRMNRATDDGKTSSFLHVEAPDFNRLHMHAQNVPLKLFFDSIGMLSDSVEVRVNGREVSEGLDYVFKDGDKIEVKFPN